MMTFLLILFLLHASNAQPELVKYGGYTYQIMSKGSFKKYSYEVKSEFGLSFVKSGKSGHKFHGEDGDEEEHEDDEGFVEVPKPNPNITFNPAPPVVVNQIPVVVIAEPAPITPEPEVCAFVPDFSTSETSLRSAIFLADVTKAAKILDRDDCFGLGLGLTYLEEQTCLVTETKEDRANDPDIVATKALALNAEFGGDTGKLATATVLSLSRPCYCDILSSTERDQTKERLQKILDDPVERKFILDYTGEEDEEDDDFYEEHVETPNNYLRRLLVTESNPTNSFFCAYCRPKRVCRGTVRWCPRN